METISIYILPIAKLVITSALLMVLYHIIYKERGGYNTNRMILLSIPIVAILLSIFRIEIFTPEPLYITLPEIPNASIPIDNEASFNTNINMEERSEGISLHIWLIILYLAGVVIQTLRIIISHHRVMKLKMGETRSINNRITIIRNEKITSPFSYCNTIFIPMELYGEKLDIVLKHEYEHIRNKHYIDLWIIEILCTTMWFNPIFIIRKTKRFAFFERTAHFFKTKCTFEGYPPFSKIFRLAYASIQQIKRRWNGVPTPFVFRFVASLPLCYFGYRLVGFDALRSLDFAAEGQARPENRARVRSIVIRIRARHTATRARVVVATINHTAN